MNSFCFVPECKSTVGVAFPKDSEHRQKWLERLNLTHLTPRPGSFICLSHFKTTDFQDEAAGGKVMLDWPLLDVLILGPKKNRLKKGAVPCQTADHDTQTSEQSSQAEGDQKTVEGEEKENKLCRACMGERDVESCIMEELEPDVTISSAFMDCIHLVQIAPDDGLPQHICKLCLESLKSYYQFYKQCVHTNNILRSQFKEAKRKATLEPETSNKKSKIEENTASESPSKPKTPCKLSELDCSDAYEVVDAESEKQDETVSKRETESQSESEPTSSRTRSSKRRSKKLKDVDIDEIEKNLEELHGRGEEGRRDDKDTSDGEETTTVEDILSTLEEGDPSDSQNVLDEFLKKKEVRIIPQKKIVVRSSFPSKSSGDFPNIKLPKDVKIKVQSSVGKYPCIYRTGVYDSTFVQADGYLFEVGLVKAHIRHLRCVVPTCSAHAKQNVSVIGEFSNTADVLTAHNHGAPNEATRKKQMFLSVMKKKLQTDKTLNIRVIYEDACSEDPEIRQLVPLRNVINEICRHQLTHKMKPITSFEDFFFSIESDLYEKLHFTHNNQQFYQEKFSVEEDESKAILFGNIEVIQQVTESKIMYVDASFKIDTYEDFKYQLVTVLVWVEDSYYPILFAIINKKSQLIFRKIFSHLKDFLAPELRPQEIITDYEANLYYALAEIYVDSNIGGSVFYYTQNLYKKICSLNLSRDLETNSYFRNIYHMLLMLPLLPVNTILDGLNNIQLEATNFNITTLAQPIFDHVRTQWILNVTPELFCVHKLENRINENVIAPFKKLRDFLLLTKGKVHKTQVTIVYVIEKIIELEAFLRQMYSKSDKKSFSRDLSSFQKKNVLRAWQFIEDHPKIEINNFFSKVLGYIKCMENQLWIWGFYRYDGDTDDILINASHFSIVSPNDDLEENEEEGDEQYVEYIEAPDNTIVMDAVIDQDGVLQAGEAILSDEPVATSQPQQFETAYIKYVYQ